MHVAHTQVLLIIIIIVVIVIVIIIITMFVYFKLYITYVEQNITVNHLRHSFTSRCKEQSPDSRWRTKRIFFSCFNRTLWLSRLVGSSFKVLLNLTSFDSWIFLETRGLSSFAKVSTWSSWHKHFKLAQSLFCPKVSKSKVTKVHYAWLILIDTSQLVCHLMKKHLPQLKSL